MRIASLSLTADYATDPAFNRNVPIKQAFINACVGENGPEQILMVSWYKEGIVYI